MSVETNFINGAFVAPATGKSIPNYTPATGKEYGRVADSDKRDVDAAVDAALAAFASWRKVSSQERAKLMYKVADIVERDLELYAKAESEDQGKPVSLARAVDIPRVVHNFRFFAGAILHHCDKASHIDNVALNYTIQAPLGVVGLVSPWNLPLYLLSFKIAPAMAAGNCMVCKPSEFTSVTAHMLCSAFVEAGVPNGVLNMVFGTGAGVGAALVGHPKIKAISFTGSTATGEKITHLAAPHFKKVSLELGGKNPNIVFSDCDLPVAISTSVRAAFANGGQICLCGSRIYVQQSIYDQFVAGFIAETDKLVVGDPSDPKTTTGPLVSAEHKAKVLSYILLAQSSEGSRVHFAGGAATAEPANLPSELQTGYYVNPTVVTGLVPTDRCQLEEIFGPVVTISPFETEEQVIELANSVEFGLSASVWTRDVTRAHRIAAQVEVGTVWVNCWLVRDLRMPFGGCKSSGVGREDQEESLAFFSEQKTVCVKL